MIWWSVLGKESFYYECHFLWSLLNIFDLNITKYLQTQSAHSHICINYFTLLVLLVLYYAWALAWYIGSPCPQMHFCDSAKCGRRSQILNKFKDNVREWKHCNFCHLMGSLKSTAAISICRILFISLLFFFFICVYFSIILGLFLLFSVA